MGLFQNHMMAAAASAGVTPAYTIDNSCRFNLPDSPYLYDTLGTATDANRWTYSTWFKRSKLGISYPVIFSAGSGGGDTSRGDITIYTDNRLSFSGGSTIWRVTTQVFTDVATWQHLIVAVNTDESGNDMIKIYLNGSQITAFDTTNNPSSAANTGINTAVAHNVGRQSHGGDGWWDGYMSEINFIDGQQLGPSSFGETNSDDVWVPIEFSGSYGNNGFFLDFESSGDLGNDVSGNNNDFTSSGLAATDQMIDTPTSNKPVLNTKTDTAVGHLSAASITEGGLTITMTASSLSTRAPATLKVSSGKWYWEAKYTGNASGQGYGHMGIWDSDTALPTTTIGSGAAGANEWLFGDGGLKNHDNTSSDTGLGNWAVNNIIQICIDLDANKIWFGFQNTFQGNPAAGSGESFSGVGDNIVPVIYGYGGGSGQGNWGPINYGNQAFTYTPPTGFEAIASDNSQDVTVSTAPTPT